MRFPLMPAWRRRSWTAKHAAGGAWWLAVAWWFSLTGAAAAQGTLGTFADPRSGPQVEAWLADEGLSAEAIEKAWPIHAAYLVAAAWLRLGVIEGWLGGWRATDAGGETLVADHLRTQIVEAKSRLDRKRRLAARLAELEDRLWAELAIATEMPAESLARLQSRGQRTRAGTPRLRMHLYGGGDGGGPLDSAGILARLRLDPERAAMARARLAGHDEAMGLLLSGLSFAIEEERIRQLESSIRQLELGVAMQEAFEAEAAAANAEGRPPRFEEIHRVQHAELMRLANAANRSVQEAALAIHRQQMTAVRSLWEILEPSERLRLAGLLGVRDDYEPLWPRIEADRRRGEISPEAAARIERIREAYLERTSSLALELGTLRESGWNFVVDADGHPQPPPAFERMNELYAEIWGDSPTRMLRELSAVVDIVPLLADLMMERGMTRSEAERAAKAYASHVAGEGDAEAEAEAAREAEQAMADWLLAMQSLPPIGEAMLEAIGEDLGIADGQRAVAAELAADAAMEQAAILARFAEASAAARAADDGGSPDARSLELPPERAEAMLREQLQVDETLLRGLAAAAGADDAKLQLWIDWRHADALAFASGARPRRDGSAAMGMGDAMPWEGGYAGVDAVAVLLAESPMALRDEAVRRAVAEHLGRIRTVHQGHWESTRRNLAEQRSLSRAMWGDAVEEAGDEAAIAAQQEQLMSLHEQHRTVQARVAEERARLARLMRADLDLLLASLRPSLGRSVQAGIRRAAWPDAVEAMPGIEAINLAESIAIEEADEARIVEIAAFANRYRARSEALFAMLDELARENERTRRSAASRDEAERAMAWRWWGTAGRLAFRHRELDFEAFRTMRAIGGPGHADRFAWSAASSGDRFRAMHFETGID